MTTHADETRAAAAHIEHEWDRRAIDWPLTRNSVVVDVGGYKGRWALQIAERYSPHLYVFEPQEWAYNVCQEVLAPYKTARVFPIALGTEDAVVMMGEWETDGCSLVKPGDHQVAMREVWRTFYQLGISDRIDLMMMNIEGYEYTLLPYMLDKGILPDRLMVQWHPLTAEMQEIGASIVRRLARRRYRLLWDYGTTLMAWEKR